MRTQIKIVDSITKYNKELKRKIAKGLIEKPEKGIIMTPETFNKVFSPERIKLMQRINKNNINNIYQLAKELNKPYEVVFRNVKYLAGLGLIELTEKDRKTIPSMTRIFSIDLFNQEIST